MAETVRLRILPPGKVVEVARGAPFEDTLFSLGIEFPCGGAGTCGGCRVRVLEGTVPPTQKMCEALTAAEIDAGWRLACQARAESDAALEIEQWETVILADDTPVPFDPVPGRLIAIDLGTTTIAAQLVDRKTGGVLATEAALNPQAAWGADVMTRIEHALGGNTALTRAIREFVAAMCSRMGGADDVLLCGNTVMQHLYCGAPVHSLSRVPFEAALHGVQQTGVTTFLPNLGGFVGSDILAGIIATRLYAAEQLTALIDLGTNGEIVVGSKDRIVCASTAAGPAFEAGRISMGMRACEGAISRVSVQNRELICHVIGNTRPRGICGSGLVDAVAAGLELGRVQPNGRLTNGLSALELAEPVALTQSDVRELQLAKAAIAAGLRLLTARLGFTPADLDCVYLAGAFGNYLTVESARRIGLIEVDVSRVVPAGNTALRGTRIIGLTPSLRSFYTEELPERVEHVPLASDPAFQDTFVECLSLKREQHRPACERS
ncbi:MAG TPA: ASKHA domain-containing protein [Bryobacteraceae bacterium]|nr:ASKHA domain-containing protein [Bryobacteraceae bacterium]